jgi:hypothetical protein
MRRANSAESVLGASAEGRTASRATIYVLTPERVPEMLGIGDVTFFAIDEF